MSEQLVIIGNGMASAKLVEELARIALGRYAIAVVGAEPDLAYNRVLLSSVLAGDMEAQEIALKPAAWWRNVGVTLRYGCAAVAVDPVGKTVRLADGQQIGFSKLVFATGSQPLRLPIPGSDRPEVYCFRDKRDADKLAALGAAGKRVVVIGGGLLGLEAAYGLRLSGATVTLVHLRDRLMERQLDPIAGALLRRQVEAKGITVVLNANTSAVEGEGRIERVRLANGDILDADAVVIAAGITPNAALAADAGVRINRGIVVDDLLRTDRADIYALGECAEHRGICYGLVEPAYDQARVLARHLAGQAAAYSGSIVATNLKVSGVNVFSAGDYLGADKDCIVLRDPGAGTYRKLVLDKNQLSGAVLIGDVTHGAWYLDLIRSGQSVAGLRDHLMFGQPAMREAA